MSDVARGNVCPPEFDSHQGCQTLKSQWRIGAPAAKISAAKIKEFGVLVGIRKNKQSE